MWSDSTEPGRAPAAPAPRQARELARPKAPPRRSGRDGRPREPEEGLFAVRVVDNPVNTYEEVIVVCARVLGVSLEEGFQIAYTVDHEGSCVLGAWPRAEAERIAAGIAVIGIEVSIEPAGA